MIRYPEKMSEIYGLGRPCSGRSTSSLRLFLSYSDLLKIKVPESLGGGLECQKPFDERELKLYDHEDTFKNAFTLLPQLPLDECKSVVEKSPRWQLAIDAGLDLRFVQPDPEIFQNRELATTTTLIIAEPVLNWCGTDECLHKLVSIERSIEDWRMKGERIRDRIKRDRINSKR